MTSHKLTTKRSCKSKWNEWNWFVDVWLFRKAIFGGNCFSTFTELRFPSKLKVAWLANLWSLAKESVNKKSEKKKKWMKNLKKTLWDPVLFEISSHWLNMDWTMIKHPLLLLSNKWVNCSNKQTKISPKHFYLFDIFFIESCGK